MEYGVLVRIQYVVESPYLQSFCKWYIDYLKFQKIYFICFDKEDVEKIKNYLREKCPNVCYDILKPKMNKTTTLNVNRSFDQFIPKLKTKYILHVDMDEYLYLGGKNIKEFVHQYKHKFNYFKFGWLQAPSDSLIETDLKECFIKNPIHIGFNGKSLSLNIDDKGKQIINGIKSHAMNISIKKIKKDFAKKPKNYNKDVKNGNPCCLLHFSSRGITDLLIKMFFQKLPNTKSANVQSQLRPLFQKKIQKLEEIPTRFLILMRLRSTENLSDMDQIEIKKILNDIPEITVDTDQLKLNINTFEKQFKKIPDDVVDYYHQLYKKFFKSSYRSFKGNHHQFIKQISQ